ncbi:flavodoxin [Neobacillus kokaensis]|uniref:Flavodoxin n=1 Tax=Neobacillus kokaensis TaxID=2759023 RepID=A0ABQ3N8L7_9BACI|nr:flavodoxin [Neobacillus kokaensis]GHI00246.1 flavodoxin [Neobacillus kokaensis]
MKQASCLIVYASMSGNTEEIANEIAKGIREAGATVEIKDILQAEPVDLKQSDGILLGAYTWDDGNLPDEFLDFYEAMDTLELKGKPAAVFGSCDSYYEHRGGAVDILTEKLTELEANIILNGLKIDLAPTPEEKEQCVQYGKSFVNGAWGRLSCSLELK